MTAILLLTIALAHDVEDCGVCHPDPGGDSAFCVQCHDGTVAPWVGLASHPVGVREDDAGALPLVRGRVECITCHEPHSGDVRSPDRLCTICHPDK